MVLFLLPILMNIWAPWIGRLDANNIRRLENGIEKEYDDNKGNEKKDENALEINLKLTNTQKQEKKIINSDKSISLTEDRNEYCSILVNAMWDSIQLSFNHMYIINQERYKERKKKRSE